MGKPTFTPAQQTALDISGRDVLVSAAAGALTLPTCHPHAVRPGFLPLPFLLPPCHCLADRPKVAFLSGPLCVQKPAQLLRA